MAETQPGMHIEPNEPPDNWTWMQCNEFAQNDSVTLEALRLDNKLSVCFRIDGEV